MNKDLLNGSGCKDPTAYEAIKNVESKKGHSRYSQALKEIFEVCEKYNLRITNRIFFEDRR